MYDYVFRDATVVDGSGNPRYKADVAVYSSLICLITKERTLSAKHVIDSTGLALSPGFIDIHSHDDIEVLKNGILRDKIMQGITTDVSGNCGVGLFPLKEDCIDDIVSLSEDILGTYDGKFDWVDFKGYKERLSRNGVGVNSAFLTSHSALRIYSMKNDSRREATNDEIDLMCALLDESLCEGSFGFSTGLYYSPCMFASRKEIAALLSVVEKHDKIFSVHHRCEGDFIIESIREILDIAKESGVRTEISHLKAIGRRNQSKIDEVLSLIENARREGCDVKFDLYPYEWGSTSLFSLLPPDIQALSRLEQRLAISLDNERDEIKKEILNPVGWDSLYSLVGPDDIKILTLESSPSAEGKSLSEIAKERNADPLDTLLDLLADETGKAVMQDVTESRENLAKILANPLSSFGTDALFSANPGHIRRRDASMHLIREFVEKDNVLTLEEAVRKMSYENALRLGLKDRGLLKEGMKADLVLFDSEKGRVEAVLVNGKPAVLDGECLNNLFGEVL